MKRIRQWMNERLSDRSGGYLVMVIDIVLGAGGLYLCLQSSLRKWGILVLLILGLGHLVFFGLKSQAQKEAMMRAKNEMDMIFTAVRQKHLKRVDELLEEPLSTSWRFYLERFNEKIDSDDFKAFPLSTNMPLIYQQTYQSLFYLFQYGERHEFNRLYQELQAWKAREKQQNEQKELRNLEWWPLSLLAVFAILFFVATINHFWEIIYG